MRFQLDPGDGTLSALSFRAIARGQIPLAYISKMRRTMAASFSLTSTCPVPLSRAAVYPYALPPVGLLSRAAFEPATRSVRGLLAFEFARSAHDTRDDLEIRLS